MFNSDISDKARPAADCVASQAGDGVQGATNHYVREPANELFSLAKTYAKDNPDVAACWAFAIGVVVGWKLKP
ncbi:hypothetical protein Q31b_54170 [Novipirellula aureliae]|uniref:Uncharacterized protein n=1 Tax=Novipirellula aureliae TaxID=2527966 RepID=A0A5C6DHW9_9BACT|nr:hypothetical protein [Novipirellula aureliae]TWU35321.1 hypothetical protein Q31b_54170 [Novipirellula aureliae]